MSYTYWDGQQNIEILGATEIATSQLHVLHAQECIVYFNPRPASYHSNIVLVSFYGQKKSIVQQAQQTTSCVYRFTISHNYVQTYLCHPSFLPIFFS